VINTQRNRNRIDIIYASANVGVGSNAAMKYKQNLAACENYVCNAPTEKYLQIVGGP